MMMNSAAETDKDQPVELIRVPKNNKRTRTLASEDIRVLSVEEHFRAGSAATRSRLEEITRSRLQEQERIKDIAFRVQGKADQHAISVRSFHDLTETNGWIRSQIINAFGDSLQKTYSTVRFVPVGFLSNNAPRVSVPGACSIALVGYQGEQIVIPLNWNDLHWSLLVLDPAGPTAKHFDSLAQYITREKLEETLAVIVSFLSEKFPEVFRERDPVVDFPVCPQQNNSSDCGVYVCMFMRAVAEGTTIHAVPRQSVANRATVADYLRRNSNSSDKWNDQNARYH